MGRFFRVIAMTVFSIVMATSAVSFAQSVPNLKARVNDYADVLSPEQESQIEAKLAAFEALPDKPQVVILTVPDTQGASIEDYSIKVARAWKIGQKDRDNGVLITVATHPEDSSAFAARIEVGYGLEGTIPDIKARAIYEATMRPHFKEPGKEDYFTAFSGAADAMYALISEGVTGIESIDNPRNSKEFVNAIGLVAMLLCFIVAIHWIIGIIFGGIGGAVAGVSLSLTFFPFLLAVIAGGVIGFLAHFVVRTILEAAGDGGYGGGGSFGGGGFSGGFGGGGGSFGGGGFSGGR